MHKWKDGTRNDLDGFYNCLSNENLILKGLKYTFFCAFGNERTQVNCTSCKANAKVYFNHYIYAKKTNKSRKNPCQFPRHLTSGIDWKLRYLPVFLCFSAGECHRSVNISVGKRTFYIFQRAEMMME